MTRLVIPKVCRDCGEHLLTVEAWDEHYRFCPGPVRLVYVDAGDPIGEVVDE
jgi:hypothetical protein